MATIVVKRSSDISYIHPALAGWQECNSSRGGMHQYSTVAAHQNKLIIKDVPNLDGRESGRVADDVPQIRLSLRAKGSVATAWNPITTATNHEKGTHQRFYGVPGKPAKPRTIHQHQWTQGR